MYQETLFHPNDFTKISNSKMGTILKNFPNIELSYETISHKKEIVLHSAKQFSYNLEMAIPLGKKYFLWFYCSDENPKTGFLLELNKEKRIVSILQFNPSNLIKNFYYGTIFYGVILFEKTTPIFMIEDLLYYQGMPTKNMIFGKKLIWIKEFLDFYQNPTCSCVAIPQTVFYQNSQKLKCLLPFMYLPDPEQPNENILKKLPYPVHHLQQRCLDKILPYINIRKPTGENSRTHELMTPPHTHNNFENKCRKNWLKPQYQKPTIFVITANIQYDIYQLFAINHNPYTHEYIYYDVACIPDLKTSVFMNQIFRKIKENVNLDYIEESDDENEFENTNPDKYVNLNRSAIITCVFNLKFKKWVPVHLIHIFETFPIIQNNYFNSKIINIMSL